MFVLLLNFVAFLQNISALQVNREQSTLNLAEPLAQVSECSATIFTAQTKPHRISLLEGMTQIFLNTYQPRVF